MPIEDLVNHSFLLPTEKDGTRRRAKEIQELMTRLALSGIPYFFPTMDYCEV